MADFGQKSVPSMFSLWGLPWIFNFGHFWQSWQFLQSLFGFAFPITAMTCDVGDSPEPPESPVFGFLGWDSGDSALPPGLFFSRVENKGRTANRPKGDPCVTLG